ncbi:MAG: mechanosensitive ion channel family protein [Oscillospiraceae bacterium]|nr:mechanosensitive ion channel family protein [Oscillospiraceae bacterium]
MDVEQTVQQARANLNTLTGNMAFDTIISGVITFLVCCIAIRIVKAVMNRALSRATKLDVPIKNLITKLITTLLWALTIIIVAGAFGINATSLVAVLSIAGLALSLSVQNLLTNFFSGIMLLINKPFKEGDFVELGDKIGTVKNIGFFNTVLNTPDNISIAIPNGDLTSAAVKNYSREQNRRVDLTFSASYDAPTEAVKKAIEEAIAMDSRILSDPAPFVRLLSYDASSIKYVVRVWVKNADYWDVYFNLNEHVRDTFANNGIAMSYEHINVHMMQE